MLERLVFNRDDLKNRPRGSNVHSAPTSHQTQSEQFEYEVDEILPASNRARPHQTEHEFNPGLVKTISFEQISQEFRCSRLVFKAAAANAATPTEQISATGGADPNKWSLVTVGGTKQLSPRTGSSRSR